MPERLEGRNGEVWRAYVAGATQERIAEDHGVSRQRIGQILAEVRESIPDTDRVDAALLAVERANALLAGVWPAAVGGDPKAVLAALRVMERTAKALGLDAVEPLRVTIERQRDLEGQLVADALGAALDALVLTQEQRIVAAAAAQAQLLGEAPSSGSQPVQGPPEPSGAGCGESALQRDVRRMLEADGISLDEGLDGEDDDDE